LLSIPSPSRQERAVAEVIVGLLANLGLECTFDDAGTRIKGDCGNIWVRVPANRSGIPALLLNAHIDTVVPCEDVRPQVRHGTIYSDGTTILGGDDKAGVIVIIEALRELLNEDIPRGPIEVVLTVAEEIGLLGALNVDISCLKARHGFVFDGGLPWEATIAAPAQKNLCVTIQGKAAHAGVNPEEGVNAIVIASHAITQMKLGRIDDETTANVGIIHGGSATNIIPDRVELQCEARSRSKGKLEAQILHMKSAFEECAAAGGGKAEVKVIPKYEAYRLPMDDILCECVKQAAAALGKEAIFQESCGGSDANVFNQQGIRSIVVGCGHHKVHTTDEYVVMDEVMHAIQNAVELVRAFGTHFIS